MEEVYERAKISVEEILYFAVFRLDDGCLCAAK